MALSAQQAYDKLEERFSTISKLSHTANLLRKDAETHMPKGAEGDRAELLMAQSQAAHTLMTAGEVEDWLSTAENDADNLPAAQRRHLNLMRHNWLHKNALPTDLAKALSEIRAKGDSIHTAHYRSGDWSKIADWYQKSFDVMREVAQVKAEALGLSQPLDALIDEWSPGFSVALIDGQFSKLDAGLQKLIPEAMAHIKARGETLPLKGPFSAESQKELTRKITEDMGYDFNRGRISYIEGHPSCGGTADDTWFTVKINESDFIETLGTTMHETGHGLYMQGMPQDILYKPAGEHLGMAIHESQSIIMERQAGQHEAFIEYMAPLAAKIFGRENDPALAPENIQKIIWTAQPSFIRVSADELTYPVHIILRYELEKQIIHDKNFDVKNDLPDVWREGMKKRLGIDPENPAQGCMQDIHWPAGYQGYFPAYALGAMIAAQFFQCAVKEHPQIIAELGQGKVTSLLAWCRKHVHSRASTVPAGQLIEEATGEALNVDYYLNHLSKRYAGKEWQG